uniref:Multidrug resistance-associated protein 1 n=1 Tax=Panagrellus redivivus TaxID=6233 RepID=A0A7E4ZTZ1_PANRE
MPTGPGFCSDPLWQTGPPSPSASAGALTNVSTCFQHTLLVFIPCALFWVLLPGLLFQCSRIRSTKRFRPLPWNFLSYLKIVVPVAPIVFAVFTFARAFGGEIPSPTINYIYPLVQAVTVLGLILAYVHAHQSGLVSSGIIFNVWLALTAAGLPELYHWGYRLVYNEDHSRGVSYAFLVWFIGCAISTVLQAFADPRNPEEEPNVELDSSYLNRLVLHWFSRLPITGSKKDLELDDLFNINDTNKAGVLEALWDYYWLPTMEKYHDKRRTAEVTTALTEADVIPAKSKDPGIDAKLKTAKSKVPLPSVIFNLFKMYKFEFILAMLVKICSDVLQFGNPYLLKQLLQYVSDPNAHLWQGLSFGILMFVVSQVRSLMINYYFFIVFRLGTKIQSTLTAVVYRKTLKLSNIARRDRTSGEIVNLMAIDVERFQMITPQIQQYWSSPFQIILALIFLFNTLGIAALPGVIITGLFVPYTFFTSVIMRKWMAQQMKLKDERTKIVNELLNGIKVIKLYAWEIPMQALIEQIRKKELNCILKSSLLKVTVDVFNWSTPFLVALGAFSTYTLMDHEKNKLTPEVAFVALTLFNQLRSPMTMIGFLINMTIEALVSNRRLKEFLVADELDEHNVDRVPQTAGNYDLIDATDADFSWNTSHHDPTAAAPGAANLRAITLRISRGGLIGVVGRVGSGKSSLLAGLLGEMEKLRGSVAVRGQVAYVPQQAWIQNMTLRNNILFGRKFDKTMYDHVIFACSLGPDLAILPNGDHTEIGEKGINLSGGQKARISLARALYQNCDIYFLDDPLSAVDSHVGKHIFKHVIGPNGLLKNKTRVLVTHGATFLKQMDHLVVVDDGRIVEQGMYDDLIQTGGKITEIMKAAKSGMEREDDKREAAGADEESIEEYDDPALSISEDAQIEGSDGNFARRQSTISALARSRTASTSSCASNASQSSAAAAKIITTETVETGRVRPSVYLDYARAATYLLMGAFFILFIGYQGVNVFRNFWLSKWADDNDPNKVNATHNFTNDQRLGIYAGLGVVEVCCLGLAMLAIAGGSIKASINLHHPVLRNILRAPMSFFDTTPIGRILNRLAKDIEVIDMRLPLNFRYFANCMVQVAFTFIIISVTTPVFMVVIFPLIGIYIFSLRYYVPTSRQLKRLESNNRSPMYSHFGETIQGASVIRAYSRSEAFCEAMNDHTDKFIRIKYMNLLANRWLAVRLELIGNLVVFFAAIFAVLSNYWGWISSAGLVGLSVSYALNVTEVLNFAVRQVSEIETNIVSVERLKEYTEIPSEAPWRIEGKSVPSGWPTAGEIEFKGYSTRYRPGLELVVRDINVLIKPGEKVGIVGRTGAGKSSLTLALFRIIESAEGQILIDGIPISEIGLHDLRESVTIIPQDPVILSGTMRFNLDPFETYSDAAIWEALEHAHLKDYVRGMPDGLQHTITEGGDNLSVGQKQLLCLARALLRRSKILVLDEATAAVDLHTDALIQETIRKEFATSTIFTIAHRLNTILDYDRVMVLDKGEIKEFDSPAVLLANKTSAFAAMVADAQHAKEPQSDH